MIGYLDVQLEGSYNLGNLFLEDLNSNLISDIDGFHLDNSDPVTIIGGSFPHTMHDVIQSSKCDSIIFEISRTYQEVKARQLRLWLCQVLMTLVRPLN